MLFYKLIIHRALRLDIYLNNLEGYIKSFLKYEPVAPDFSSIFESNKPIIVQTELRSVESNTERTLENLFARHGKKNLNLSCANLTVDEFKQIISGVNEYDYLTLKDIEMSNEELLQSIEDFIVQAKGIDLHLKCFESEESMK